MKRILLLTLVSAAALFGQGTATKRSVVQALGDGVATVTPDQGHVNFSVVTQAQTAQDAASQNASAAANVISQLKAALGASGDVKTVSYSLVANYNYPQGQQPVLVGYTATNTVQATVNDLSIIGKVIDTGVAAGASRIDSLSFGLKDDSAARAQALKSAVQRAKAKADAMALSLGMRTGNVIVLQEAGANVTPILLRAGDFAGAAASTPIQTGTLDVRANVTIEVELLQ